MVKLIIILGSGCHGKTTYAEYLQAKGNCGVVELDKHYVYGGDEDVRNKRLDKICGLLKEIMDSGKLAVLDGCISENCNAFESRLNLTRDEYKIHLLFLPVWEMANRQLIKKGDWRTYKLFDIKDAVYVESSQPMYPQLTYDDFVALKPAYYGPELTHADIKAWAEEKPRSYDGHYQYVYLGYDQIIKGYSPSVESWRQIRTMVDFKDKAVLDIGCFLGYFGRQAGLAGAKAVMGIDRDTGVCTDAAMLNVSRRSHMFVVRRDADNFNFGVTFDIVLMLNMFHHIEDPVAAIKNLNAHTVVGSQLVMEINVEDEPTVLNLATNWKQVKSEKSYRKRLITVLQKIE